MKFELKKVVRRRHNTTGLRQVRRGRTRGHVARIAQRMGVRFIETLE
ncbi:MAG: hypothetical protein KJ579_02495 [Verrucomicrobia bacterium]|nr:hypothetical protein [Verrucomicrobiota bacterium]